MHMQISIRDELAHAHAKRAAAHTCIYIVVDSRHILHVVVVVLLLAQTISYHMKTIDIKVQYYTLHATLKTTLTALPLTQTWGFIFIWLLLELLSL